MEKLLKKYDLTRDEILKVKKESKIKNADILKDKINEIKKCLNLTEEDMKEILVKFPNLLTYSTEMITKRQEEFNENLGFSTEEFKTLIVRAPETISYGNQAIYNKSKFLNDKIGLTKNEFKSMILKQPAILTYSKESLNKKINLFLNNGLERKVVINNPILFSLSTSSFVTRLAICKYFHISMNAFIQKRFFMENESKLYSNLMYLKEKNLVYSRYNLITRKLPKSNRVYTLYPFDKESKKKMFFYSDIYDENGNEIK